MIFESPYTFFELPKKCVYSSIMEVLYKGAKETPDKPILISAEDPTQFFTCCDLIKTTHAIETFLENRGFEEGNIGATVMPNYIEIVPFFLAVLGRGGNYTGMAPGLTKYEIENQLSDCGATFVLTTAHLFSKIKKASETHNIKLICIGEENQCEDSFRWDDVLRTEGNVKPHSYNLNSVALMPYTSGTTGLRKGVLQTHSSIMTAALNFIRHLNETVPLIFLSNNNQQGILGRPQIMIFPTYHISGAFLIIAKLLAGSTIIMLSQYDIQVLLRSIEIYKVRNLFASSPVVLNLVKDPLVKEYDITSLHYITTGGSAMPMSLSQEVRKLFPQITVIGYYGMTECVFPVLPLFKQDLSDSVGVMSPGFHGKVVDVNTGEFLKINQAGEIVVKGPSVTKGYYHRPDATAEAIKDGWFYTGDIGHFNENGELFVVDRKKELIKVNGLQVAPAEIESVLASDPRIRDVGVVGLPHPVYFEVAGAFVVKNDQSLKKEDVHEIIKEHLASYKWLGGVVEFVDQIPKLSTGKILRRELQKMYFQ